MGTVDPARVALEATTPPQEQLSRLFGSYKAEWLREHLFDLFTEPSYFPELVTERPCVLVGGRGTGKTTVLRCLSYEGQFALTGRDPKQIESSSFYGVYYRVNTNRVTAFKGPELPESDWVRLFAHYFNLIVCDEVLRFLAWYELHTGTTTEIGKHPCNDVSAALNLAEVDDLRSLRSNLASALVRFEAYINNVVDAKRPLLSLQGQPIDTLFSAIGSLPSFQNKYFFILLDEYENFEDYQQRVVNSLIKHASTLHTFKIGVRELGLRQRTTLNENEQLISPADYVRVNISEKLEGDPFRNFARAVCNSRVSRVRSNGHPLLEDIVAVLPSLSEDAEAELLGVRDAIDSLRSSLQSQLSPSDLVRFDSLPPLKAYLVGIWAEAQNEDPHIAFRDLLAHPTDWETRYSNYKHALLYTLKRGRRGIRRYYSGWDLFTQLAASNIRYLLELVEQSLLAHINNGNSFAEPVPADVQTQAAQRVGKKNLSELEGLSVYGAQLTKLVLSLGRVFGVMAERPLGHAPEVNQFHLKDGAPTDVSDVDGEADRLLKSAVMHLALLRFSGSKPADEGDTRDYDYTIHPIFSPFFVFSYRRKRKMQLTAADIVALVKNPKQSIREILARTDRALPEEMPEQLLLFESYYRDS